MTAQRSLWTCLCCAFTEAAPNYSNSGRPFNHAAAAAAAAAEKVLDTQSEGRGKSAAETASDPTASASRFGSISVAERKAALDVVSEVATDRERRE